MSGNSYQCSNLDLLNDPSRIWNALGNTRTYTVYPVPLRPMQTVGRVGKCSTMGSYLGRYLSKKSSKQFGSYRGKQKVDVVST